ncbi:hypothetical protein NADFUDRAFT_13955, partial [Nadsonia fulvescens var. elongata DSM 6958]
KRYHELFHHYFPQSTTNPISYLISFLFLHELTAIIPLFGFWILFWFIDWDPLSHDTERQGLDSDSEINDPQLYKIDNWATISTYLPKFLAQGATSYALVKVLAPVRVIISIMLMPMVAKTVFIPMSNV